MKRPRLTATVALLASLAVVMGVTAAPEGPATPAAKPPFWAEKGVFVYRVFTPDAADTLVHAEKGVHIVSNLLDGSMPQIAMFNGLIGHDHPGAWNWDGLWPYWNRVTYRAGSWKNLSGFMTRIRDNSNTLVSFHVNLTDVNIGLRDYPESREFFKKLVETRSIYRRDWDKAAGKRAGDPYVPQEIDRFITQRDENGHADPVPIFALVDYKKFWGSGLAKRMFDEFYAAMPYAPPMLYLDVLTLSGGNFSTGYPDGPLGGSQESQIEGAIALVDYLRGKGTDTGTEGNRPFLGRRADGEPRSGYVWYHGNGYSNDNYSVISGGNKVSLVGHHVHGNPGAFAVSPVASTADGLATVNAHYAALLAGKPGVKAVAGLDTWRISKRSSETKVDEFDVPGANGDVFRGDWADLVNYFYLVTIQENYHMGNRSIRTRADGTGTMHLGTYTLSNGKAPAVAVTVSDFVPDRKGRPFLMLESPVTTKATVASAGRYRMSIPTINANARSGLNVYVNDRLHRSFRPADLKQSPIDIGEVELTAGENTLSFDVGAIRSTWSDGTVAEWTTPYLRKGFKVWNGDVVFAEDYDRMWPDSWSGQKKIYFFSWDGSNRTWKLPRHWADVTTATLYPLTPEGRGKGIALTLKDGSVSPRLLPQVPFVLVPDVR